MEGGEKKRGRQRRTGVRRGSRARCQEAERLLPGPRPQEEKGRGRGLGDIKGTVLVTFLAGSIWFLILRFSPLAAVLFP